MHFYLLAFCTIGILLRCLIVGFDPTWQDDLGLWLLNVLSLYAGVYLSTLVIYSLTKHILNAHVGIKTILHLCIYSNGFIFLAFALGIAFDSVMLTLLASLYVFQVVFPGIVYLQLPGAPERNKIYTLVSGFIIILAPLLAKAIILLMLPGIV